MSIASLDTMTDMCMMLVVALGLAGRPPEPTAMRHLIHAAHIALFALTVHLWHTVASDRMLDAYADVGMDKAVTFILRTSHVAAE